MRIRWITALALVLVFSSAIAASAAVRIDTRAGVQSRTASVTIDFWNYWDGNNATAISDLLGRDNQSHKGIVVKNVTFPWGDLYSKMQAASAGSGENLPAVAAGDIAWMAALHRSGRLVNLTPTVNM